MVYFRFQNIFSQSKKKLFYIFRLIVCVSCLLLNYSLSEVMCSTKVLTVLFSVFVFAEKKPNKATLNIRSYDSFRL